MKLIFRYVLFLILQAALSSAPPQTISSPSRDYLGGMNALSKNDFKTAENLFQKSVRENNDASSLFQLAKIYAAKNTPEGRRFARELLEHAVLKDPQNIQYKFFMADILSKISGGLAYGVYLDILKLDENNALALYKLGLIEEKEFDEFRDSFFKTEDDLYLSYEKFAVKDFVKAENFFKRAISNDSLMKDAYLHLSFLYEDAGKPDSALKFLQKAEMLFPNRKDIHLYLGLLYYENSELGKSFNEYKNALPLMSEAERKDFTFNSVKELLDPVLGKEFKNYSEREIEELINYFWKINDPLFLTDYNERLLEHYSRVAYANLRFASPGDSVPGWKTEKGEIMLRYGEPVHKFRLRPQISAGGRTTVNMKTDVWQYNNFTLGFTDQFMNGKFVFSEYMPGNMFVPQLPGETPLLVNYLRKTNFTSYKPKFNGPVFSVPFSIVQFRNFNKENISYTDVYVNYGLPAADSQSNGSEYKYKYEWGLFFFDSVFNPIYQKKGLVSSFANDRKIITGRPDSLLINSLSFTAWPDSGNLAFELIRSSDNGVFTYHYPFKVKKFGGSRLSVSDIVLASELKKDTFADAPLKRGEYSITPNPSPDFSPHRPLYIYFEVYNLKPDKSGSYSFEQNLILMKKDENTGLGSAVNSVLNLIGLGKKSDRLAITSNYISNKNYSRIYLQLDMSRYSSGAYDMRIAIKDNVAGFETAAESSFVLK